MNSILLIQPYLLNGIWCFDFPEKNIQREPFVGQVNEWINGMVKDIPNAEKGFNLLFSAQPFPEYMEEFEWSHEQYGGDMYFHVKSDSIGYLCPCLRQFLPIPPPVIYARAEPFRA